MILTYVLDLSPTQQQYQMKVYRDSLYWKCKDPCGECHPGWGGEYIQFMLNFQPAQMGF